MRLFEAGSAGRAYLLKERWPICRLGAAIRSVASGGSVVDPRLSTRRSSVRANEEASVLDRLTER